MFVDILLGDDQVAFFARGVESSPRVGTVTGHVSGVVTRVALDMPQLPAVHAALEETEAGLAAPETRLLGTSCGLVTHVPAHVTPEILFRFRTLSKVNQNQKSTTILSRYNT